MKSKKESFKNLLEELIKDIDSVIEIDIENYYCQYTQKRDGFTYTIKRELIKPPTK